jgi:HTH-type transcriptional regulator / antitoxin HigA
MLFDTKPAIAHNYLNFGQQYPDAEDALKAWFYEVRAQTWQESRDVLKFFVNAKIEKDEEICFEIIADRYCLKAVFKSSRQILFIKSIEVISKNVFQNSAPFSAIYEENMHIKPIYTEEDLQMAVDRLEDLFPAKEGTPEYDEFVILSELILAFQNDTKEIDFPDPVEAIRYHMWFKDQDEEGLGNVIGSQKLASNILNRTEKLTLPIVWKLCKEWKIPAECLIKPY